MAEPDDLVLDMLRALRGDMARTAGALRSVNVGIRPTRQRSSGVRTIQDRDHDDVPLIGDRLDRIERRLEPAD